MNPHIPNPSTEPEPVPEIRRARTSSVWLAGCVLLVALAALYIIGWYPRHKQSAEARSDAAELASLVPVLAVSHPKETVGEGNVILPCDVKAEAEASIQTRANGYLKALHADLGDRVDAGQLLAEIDAPEVDAELARGQALLLQSRANLAKALTGLELSERSLKRYQDLAKGAASAEDLDVKTSARQDAANVVEQEKANVRYAEAEVRRLVALQGFGKLVAPFAGRISARTYDVGALISSGGASGGTELFRLVKSDVVRVFVRVPQVYASDVTEGGTVVLRVRNEPGRDFIGHITRKAGEFDATTRTMLFEAQVPNSDGRLSPGMYGQLQLALTARKPVLVLPTGAILAQGDGTRVLVVQDGVCHLKKVTLGRDFGADLEILSGLAKDDWVAVSPPALAREGAKVKVSEQQEPSAAKSSGK